MVYKTSKIIFILIFLLIGHVSAQVKVQRELDPVIKSLLIPGWGQKSLGELKRSRIFNYVESTIVLSIIGSSTFSNIEKKNYISFASEHAAISSSGKDHKYWVDIGNYRSITEYNEEHLRNRQMSDLYPDDKKWSWDWDFDSNREAFEEKRINSDKLKLIASFGIGAMVLNHIVSSIDALYLKRVNPRNKLFIHSYKNESIRSIGYSLTFSF